MSNIKYSLGVVTYVARYDKHFLPLIKQLSCLFPDTEIIVAINGYYDPDIQGRYLEKILNHLKGFSNIVIIPNKEPQSLSRLWNEIIKKSSFDKTIILNDDLQLNNRFRKHLNNSSLLLHDVAIINRSWSHFLISKRIIQKIGWFDERFFGVGFEDHDYETRLAVAGIKVPSISLKGIRNIIFQTTDFSYAKSVEVTGKKYVKGNEAFFLEKWMVSSSPMEGFVWVRILKGFAKIKEGMETPDFGQEHKVKMQV